MNLKPEAKKDAPQGGNFVPEKRLTAEQWANFGRWQIPLAADNGATGPTSASCRGPKHHHEVFGGILRLEVVVLAADEMNRAVGLKVLNVRDILSVDPHDATGCVRDFDPSHLASRGSRTKYPGRDSNS
jgi:hypothetical protein